jgi:hypothetical protein
MKRLRIATAGGAVVAALAAIGLGFLATRQYLGYDSVWHVFNARQEGWLDFWREVQDNAHPPLFYLLLKAAVAVLGKSYLAYRLWSILGIAASTVLLSRLTCRLTGNAPLGIVAAAAFAFSAAAAEVGLEVRSYAVFLAFAIAALSAWVEWIAAPLGRVSSLVRAVFAASLSGAILSHYSAFFVLGATIVVPALLWRSHPRWRARLRAEVASRPRGLAVMFGVPLAVAGAIWAVHLRRYPSGIGHVAEFMFDRHVESRFAFLLRTTRSMALLFLPDIGLQGFAATAAAVLLIGGLFSLFARRAVRGHLAVIPFAFLLTMAVANAVAGLRGAYPFGGYTRHEVFLFPFALLSLFVGFELARRALPRRASNNLAWTGAAGLLVAASTWHVVSTYKILSTEIDHALLDRFHDQVGRPPAVLVDQFNLIMFFSHFHDWRWRLRWQETSAAMWQVWEVSRGDEQFAVCRERVWQSDFTTVDVYGDLDDCLQRAAVDRVAVFRLQHGGGSPPWKTADVLSSAREWGPKVRLDPIRVYIDGYEVYASFQRLPGSEGSERIFIVEATYGEICRGLAGNATGRVRDTCDGHAHCVARASAGAPGDPAPGCIKDFVVAFRCGKEQQLRRARLPSGAPLGGGVLLSCAPH